MPPKDDEDPKTTKDVVSKKHKQMLNREELDLSLVAESFCGILMEAPKKNPSGGQFKEPEPPKSGRTDPKIDPQQADIDDFKREIAQSGGRSKGSKSKSVNPAKYEFDPKTGAPTRKSVETYATRLTTRGYGDAGYDPVKRGVSDPGRQAKIVSDTFSAADKGDAKSQQQIQKWTAALTKKHGSKPAGVEETGERRSGQITRSRSTGRTKKTKSSVGQLPTTPPSEFQSAASDYESDIRQGKTTPEGRPRPTAGAEGRKSYRDLMKDIQRERGRGRSSTTTTQPSTPERVKQQRAQEYRAAGGGRRSQYLRRTGRLPSIPTSSTPTSSSVTNVPSQPPKPSQIPNVLKRIKPGSPLSMAANIVVGGAIDYAAKKYVIDPLSKGLTKSLLKPSKGRNLFPSYYKSPQGKEYQGPDLEPEIASRIRRQTKTDVKTQKTLPVPPAPPILGLPRLKPDNSGGRTRTRPTRTTKSNRLPRFGFPDQPDGKIGRRQNPQ
jgi:hypothetical protein